MSSPTPFQETLRFDGSNHDEIVDFLQNRGVYVTIHRLERDAVDLRMLGRGLLFRIEKDDEVQFIPKWGNPLTCVSLTDDHIRWSFTFSSQGF